ncbi:transposase [Zunongwangia atlantica 22II14-10F7]|uniref:DDE-type integrase/transposase/recombinase n=1 Tax=Zunongwangia atlantica TaxID=1502297 RepID=UPI0021D14DCD
MTFIPMQKEFMYLVAIIDLQSRYFLNWSVSNSVDAKSCKEILEEAIDNYGTPEIINTYQGGQFASEIFTHSVLSRKIKLSMDGKGRAIDNVFIGRLWRNVKHESIYLNPQESGINLYWQLGTYFSFYNYKRRHQRIENEIPINQYLKLRRNAA